MSESFWTIAFLTLSGGFQDAYSYFARGHVFANAQTGNIIFLSQSVVTGNLGQFLHYSIPLAFFCLGFFAAGEVWYHFRHFKKVHWRQMVLGVEIFLLFLVPWIGNDIIANSMISFACAMQVQSFRKVRGQVFSSTMCIGNMRGMMENLDLYLHTRKRPYLLKFNNYVRVLLMFFAGAAAGALVVEQIGLWSIWVCCGLLLISLCLMFFHEDLPANTTIRQAAEHPGQIRKELEASIICQNREIAESFQKKHRTESGGKQELQNTETGSKDENHQNSSK